MKTAKCFDTVAAPRRLILAGGALLVLAVLFVDLRQMGGYFFSDEAVYYASGLSAAYDFDLEYTREDLIRINRLGWVNGPEGILLTRRDQDHRIYFAKPVLYPIVAAPFVRLFGENGFLAFNAVILSWAIYLSFLYLARWMPPRAALVTVGIFYGLSAAPIYVFWIHPEIFNLGLLVTGLFFFLHYERQDGSVPWPYYLSPLLFGMAAYSRLPIVLFAGPQIAVCVWRQRWRSLAIIAAVLAASYLAMTGLQILVTGLPNPYAGDRRIFYGTFPLQSDSVDFAQLGSKWSTAEAKFYFQWPMFFKNLFYFFTGRHSGMLLYFLPAILGVLGFFGGRRALDTWLVLLTITASILALIVMIPTNYHGGSGTIGNRYFMAVYPAFLFLMRRELTRPVVLTTGFISAAFTLQLLTGPLTFSFRPALAADNLPFRLFPIEKTLVDSLPHQGGGRTRVKFGGGLLMAYFINQGSYGRDGTEDAFWIKGEHQAEILFVTRDRPKVLVFTAINSSAADNALRIDGDVVRIEERGFTPWESRDIIVVIRKTLPLQTQFGNFKHVMRIDFTAERGAVLKYEGGPADGRYLGIRLLPRTDPFTLGRALLEKGFAQDAAIALQQAVEDLPHSPAPRHFFARALRALGQLDEAEAQQALAQQLIVAEHIESAAEPPPEAD